MQKLRSAIRRVLKALYDSDMEDCRVEVVQFLSQRPSIAHEEWHRRYATAQGIPLPFVAWFRDTCSRYFEYDLSSAVPEDRLVDDLGLFSATWGDTDLDIIEEYEEHFGGRCPSLEHVFTFGQCLQILWSHLPEAAPPVATGHG